MNPIAPEEGPTLMLMGVSNDPNRIRRLAGGRAGYSGDNGPALNARLVRTPVKP